MDDRDKQSPGFDMQAAHKHFAKTCFNRAWELIDKTNRSPMENEEMVRCAYASWWHWTQVQDSTPKNISISLWQISRVYSILFQAGNALHYAQLCLMASNNNQVEPFYLAYAYEAMARAAAVGGDRTNMDANLKHARELSKAIKDPESKRWLEVDLDSVALMEKK